MELNAKLVHADTHVGVYVNHNRKGAVAVRVKNGIVHYLTMATGDVTLQTASIEKFKNEFILQLYQYPVRRACRVYAASGLAITNEARSVLRAVLAG